MEEMFLPGFEPVEEPKPIPVPITQTETPISSYDSVDDFLPAVIEQAKHGAYVTYSKFRDDGAYSGSESCTDRDITYIVQLDSPFIRAPGIALVQTTRLFKDDNEELDTTVKNDLASLCTAMQRYDEERGRIGDDRIFQPELVMEGRPTTWKLYLNKA